jgi:hypothetical protein
MAKSQLHELARAGAQARLAELDQERESLLGMFPDLRGGGRKAKAASVNGTAPKRKRRSGMSAEARKAQGERMKAYWAKRRAEKAAATGENSQAGAAVDGTSRKSGRKAGRRQGRKK